MRFSGLRSTVLAALLLEPVVGLETAVWASDAPVSNTLPADSAAAAAISSVALEPAAVHALRWAFYAPNGYRWEYSGILVMRDGEVMNNAFPRTLKRLDAVPMDATQQLNPGDTLVGLYHTHPCKPKQYLSAYYSPQDLISVFFYHVPSFILDECTGDVHEFDPLTDQVRGSGRTLTITQSNGISRVVHLPAGRVVGNIGDRGPDLSAIEALVGKTLYE
jgi:hypothetical protein